MMFKKTIDQLNIFAQRRRYGIPLWQYPPFLFSIMGTVINVTSVTSYLIGTRYMADPEVVALVVLIVTAFLFIIAFVITQSFERLAEASQMKSEFINIVSHQLRSPLTNIKWTFEILTSKEIGVSLEREEEYLNNVKENIARMVELIDNLLIVSKIEQGSFPILKREISLEDLIEELVLRFEVFAEASNVKLNFYPQKNLPKILADSSLMKLVIENLIDNAIHYTKGGGMVEIKFERKKENALFSIKDTGVGIPKKDQIYIFQKFFRAANILREQTQGSGLGLYICKSIIDRSGGKIWFESKEGEGTTFYFTHPIK